MILNTSIINNSLNQLPVNLQPYGDNYVRNSGSRALLGKNIIVLPDIKIPIFVDKEVHFLIMVWKNLS